MLISSYYIFKDKQEDKKQENTFEELVEIAEDKEQNTNDIKEDTINIEERKDSLQFFDFFFALAENAVPLLLIFKFIDNKLLYV